MSTAKAEKIVVIGAGPVGALAALYAASRGYDVEVYELRGDLRDPSTVPLNFTRSINLALSERGISAVRHAKYPGLLEAIMAETIPMYGRMVHGRRHGRLYQKSQAYDVHGRALGAVDRGGLNKKLLDTLENLPNVKLFFRHKLTGADFKRKLAWLERREANVDYSPNMANRAPEIEISFDFMIGADGAHSAVRYHLMKFARISYQQEYIDTLWCEFHIPPSSDGNFRLSPNHLHIWPAKGFMFIAIPSLDKSFTSTLFLPHRYFAELDSRPHTLKSFFEKHFPGVVPNLISEEDLLHQFAHNPHLPLVSVKCRPYHFNSSVVVVGDAAHAMVPFYGQGMNTGFEDVRYLFEHLDKYADSHQEVDPAKSRAAALGDYTEFRWPDAVMINDLALRNYQEMRSDVQSSFYRLRKWIEEALDMYYPHLGWATQYSRISFGTERYSEVARSTARQLKILQYVAGATLTTTLIGLIWAGKRWRLLNSF